MKRSVPVLAGAIGCAVAAPAALGRSAILTGSVFAAAALALALAGALQARRA